MQPYKQPLCSGLIALLATSSTFDQVDCDHEWTNASAFTKAGPAWITTVTDGDQIGGATEWEYVRWTNKGQFEPGFGSDF